MDTSVLVIGVISVLIFVVPFALFGYNRKNKVRRIKSAFINEASKNKMQVDDCDVWNSHYCIGVDPVSKQLLYRKTNDYEPQSVLINLKDISKCRVINTTHIIKNSNEKVAITDAISLAFNYKNSSKPEEVIEIFNSRNSNGISVTDEPKIAEKWESLVNNIVS